jgi:hypothetical protein
MDRAPLRQATVRIYSAASEEARRARDLLKDWVGEGFLSEAQYRRMQQETPCDLRTTNIFLRIVLFLFTSLIAGATWGLFGAVFLSNAREQTLDVFLLIFAAILYAAAEWAVFRFHLYRYGIEEALAVCSGGFLCGGIEVAFFTRSSLHGSEFLVFATGALFSLWIWRRFGLEYAFPATMIFIVFLPGYWTSSHWAQHLIIAVFYAAGLAALVALDYRDADHSLAEALLWLGVYVAMNLQLSSLNLLGQWLGGPRAGAEFSRPFYWATWVLTWCLPPIVLARGMRRRDRLVMAVGAITAVATLATNKPYLGWQRHTWDPMLLGALLIGLAVFLRRWLASGPRGIRHGFTAERLSGMDKQLMSAGSTVLGVLSPQLVTRDAQASSPEVHFGGGDSGGGGATGEF